ncbi:MAG TPA: biotin/lipoyl-binding protein, partial [Hyphomicrobiaceae bacterium]|nr:biotin/lipoyl-binding protein [Hyphomicrobiaceae bacterium]
GMRIAASRKEVAEGFALARSEAKSSFGDDRVFVEKFIVDPRHIEIQVLGDKHGNVIYLGERECSIQRRNQKVIEEAPSPLLDEKTRRAMGEQAVALAKAVGYDSAGTVEFVAGQDRSFFFLEMNTRLQVEHPVTELVTGLDLVELMIRSAAGEKLPLKQADVKLKGWAIESRIYAEDPYRNFLPSIGRLSTYRPPAEGVSDGKTIRNDTGVYEGGEISMFYDPMIAKLCTHGPTRDSAIDLMAEALDAFAIDGIQHNIPFLTALMQSPRWRSGKLSTGFIREEYPSGFKPRQPDPMERERVAAVAAHIDHLGNSRRRQISQQITGPSVRFAKQRIVDVGGTKVAMEVCGELGEPTYVTILDDHGKPRETIEVVSSWWPGESVWQGKVGGKPVSVLVKPTLNGNILAHRGLAAVTYVYTQREAELAGLMPTKSAADTSKLLLCPMPGLIKAIHVKEGAEVKAGDSLAVVEAMKMENILKAERDAVVKAVKCKAGDSLAVDAVILEFA